MGLALSLLAAPPSPHKYFPSNFAHTLNVRSKKERPSPPQPVLPDHCSTAAASPSKEPSLVRLFRPRSSPLPERHKHRLPPSICLLRRCPCPADEQLVAQRLVPILALSNLPCVPGSVSPRSWPRLNPRCQPAQVLGHKQVRGHLQIWSTMASTRRWSR